jgi:hypothetical protein
MKSCLYSLIRFLPFLLNPFRLPSPVLYLSILLHLYTLHIHFIQSLMKPYNYESFLYCFTTSRELDPIVILAAWDTRCIASRRSHRKHRFLCFCEGVFTALLHSNGSYSSPACVFVAAGIRLLGSCLAMDISDFTVPAFGRHITIK